MNKTFSTKFSTLCLKLSWIIGLGRISRCTSIITWTVLYGKRCLSTFSLFNINRFLRSLIKYYENIPAVQPIIQLQLNIIQRCQHENPIFTQLFTVSKFSQQSFVDEFSHEYRRSKGILTFPQPLLQLLYYLFLSYLNLIMISVRCSHILHRYHT